MSIAFATVEKLRGKIATSDELQATSDDVPN